MSTVPNTPPATAAGGGRAPAAPEGRNRRSTVVLFVVLTSQVMIVLDAAIVNVALPDIKTSLHFSTGNLSWVLNAYTLVLGGLLLLGARAGDIFGRRQTFLVGVSVFALASLAGGLAPTSGVLVGARAAQGVGGALAAPSSLALLTTMFPDGKGRAKAIGLYTLVSISGSSVGLILGGVLTQSASWRWVMFVNVPIAVAVLATGFGTLPRTTRVSRPFDLAGALSSTAGVGTLVYAFIRAGQYGWSDPMTLAMLPVSLALLAVFVAVERNAAEPITPLRLLVSGAPSRANLARALSFAGTAALLFFLSQYVQQVLGWSPLRTGLAFLPGPVCILVATQLTSRVLYGKVPARPLTVAGLALMAGGFLALTRLGTTSTYPLILLALVLYGLGAGVSVVTLMQAALTGVAPADAGAASGLVNVYQQIGATLGIAVLETVFSSATRSVAGTARHVLAVSTDRAFLGATVITIAAIGIATTVGPRPRPRRRTLSTSVS